MNHTADYNRLRMLRAVTDDEILIRVALNVRMMKTLSRYGTKRLSEKLGITPIYLDTIQYGKQTTPVSLGVKICQVLKITPNMIFTDDFFMESETDKSFLYHTFDHKDIGRRCKYFREEQNLSLQDLSDRLKEANYPMSANRLQKIEEGKETLTLVVFERLLKIFDIDPNTFFYEELEGE